MWATLITSIIGGIKTIFGDRSVRETNAADDMAALRQQFAAEFSGPERTGLWNSLVDGLNRLVRPVFTFGTLGLFVWCVISPFEFMIAMAALQTIPDGLWILMGTIVSFWFGERALGSWNMTGVSAKSAQTFTAEAAQLKKLKALNQPMNEERFQREMADEDAPLSDEAIAEWNRRRKE